MTATVALALICGMLLATLVINLISQANERKQWTVERRELVNRAIARHAGEAIALDRTPLHSVRPGPLDNPVERPTPVGL